MFSLYIYIYATYMAEVAHHHSENGGSDPPQNHTRIPFQCKSGIIIGHFLVVIFLCFTNINLLYVLLQHLFLKNGLGNT